MKLGVKVLLFVGFMIGLIVIITASMKEYFRYSSSIGRFSTYSQLPSVRSTSSISRFLTTYSQSFPVRSTSLTTYSHSSPVRSTSPTTYSQSPSLGNAYYSSSTGIVPGSYLAPLQNQYKSIFTPRPTQTMSGQTQMSTHLSNAPFNPSYNPYASPTPQSGPISSAPGLGITGWISSPYNPYRP